MLQVSNSIIGTLKTRLELSQETKKIHKEAKIGIEKQMKKDKLNSHIHYGMASKMSYKPVLSPSQSLQKAPSDDAENHTVKDNTDIRRSWT